jgi:hypothetical protein
MKYIQVGELGKAALVGNKDALPTPGILFLNKFYVASNTGVIYTCKVENDVYSWKVVATLPELTNGIAAPTQLQEGVEAIDANGNKVTGTMKFVEKTAYANGTYYPDNDNAQGYSKFIVDVAGDTAENPYVATTEAEMRAYLAEEYVGSFVRFENARYRNITLPASLPNSVTNGAFDTYLAQSRMNKYIDRWTVGNNNRKIFSSNGRQNFTISNTSVYRDAWHNIYAYKYKNSDGSYCRALVGTVHFLQQDYINPEYAVFLLYIDGYIANDTVFPNYPDDYTGSTLTGTISTVLEDAISVNGWYQDGVPSYNDYMPDYGDKPGYATMSWSITQAYGNNGVVTYLYSDAALILYRVFGSSANTDETSQHYQELGVYRVNKKITSISKWVNAQPLQVGDTYAGATVYFNTNLTYEDINTLLSTIPDSEFFTEDNQSTSVVFNIDNPLNLSTAEQNVVYKAYLGLLLVRASGYTMIMSLSTDDMWVLTQDGWQVTSLLLKPSLDEVTQDATITKINYPDIIGQLVGKSATFTKGEPEQFTSYNLELMLDAGEVEEVALTGDVTTFSKKSDNIGKVIRYTGYESSTPNSNYPYKKGALYILTED